MNNPASLKFGSFAAPYTPVVPYAARGPLQYVEKFIFEFNSTENGNIYIYILILYICVYG